jgi:hypothetical protein
MDVEDDDGDAVLARKRDRRGVHDLQVARQHVHVAQRIVALGTLVLARIGRVDAVDLVPLNSASQPISAARRAAAVSVVKNGLPVPAAKITTLPFSIWRAARRRM